MLMAECTCRIVSYHAPHHSHSAAASLAPYQVPDQLQNPCHDIQGHPQPLHLRICLTSSMLPLHHAHSDLQPPSTSLSSLPVSLREQSEWLKALELTTTNLRNITSLPHFTCALKTHLFRTVCPNFNFFFYLLRFVSVFCFFCISVR